MGEVRWYGVEIVRNLRWINLWMSLEIQMLSKTFSKSIRLASVCFVLVKIYDTSPRSG